jgi:VWFA-related protein
MMRDVVASLFLVALICLFKGGVAAQENDETIRVMTREVFFEVLVRDKRTGAPVADLTSENFELHDDGKPRQLSYFGRVGDARRRPLALILVLDLRPDGAGRFLRHAEFTKSLAAPVSQLPQDDEVAVLAVSVEGQWGKWKWLTDLTHDRADITKALSVVPSLVGDKKAFRTEYQNSFGEIVEDIARMATQRRPNSQVVLVLVSDSINTLDGVFFTDREKIDAKLLRANLTFSALTHDLSAKHKTLAAASKPIFILARASLTGNEQHFATMTGGEALNVNTPGAFAEGLERIVGGLTARYSLAFRLNQDVPNDGRLHRLEVKVTALDAAGKKRKLQVSARRGYYLPQIPSAPAKPTTSTPTNKAEAQQAIRNTLYTLEYAYATGDIETVRRLTAKRTLDLYHLCFSLLSKDSGLNTDDLFAHMVQAVAAAAPQMTPEKIKEQARKNADRLITFLDEKTARIAGDPGAPASLAILEDGIWKIDDTEMIKEDFLKSDGLTSADKKRIKDF